MGMIGNQRRDKAIVPSSVCLFYFVFLLSLGVLQGCGNRLFYYPSAAEDIHPDMRLLHQPLAINWRHVGWRLTR